MADSLGKAVLELFADSTGLKGDLDTAESKVRTSAELMQSLLGAIGIGFSLKAVLDATVEAERESNLLANAVRATGMAAGFTAEQLKAQQAVLQQSTGIGDEAISSMQRTLMTFKNVHGEVFQSAIQLSLDFAAATGGDATDAARKFGMALNDPVNNMGLLKRAGVAVTDELKAQVEVLVKNGDLVGAQTLLINELSKSYGGAALAARDTLGGALNALKENFGNLFLEQQGAGVQLRQFIELVNQSLPTVANTFSAVFATIRSLVEGVVSNLFYMGQGLDNLVRGELKAAAASFSEIVGPTKLASDAVAAGTLAFKESASSMEKATAASAKLAAQAPVTAGIMKKAAAEAAASARVEDTKKEIEAAEKAAQEKKKIQQKLSDEINQIITDEFQYKIQKLDEELAAAELAGITKLTIKRAGLDEEVTLDEARFIRTQDIEQQRYDAEVKFEQKRNANAFKQSKIYEVFQSANVAAVQNSLSIISTLQTAHSKELMAIGRAAAIANIIMSTAQGIMKAYAENNWYVATGIGLAITAAGAVQMAKVTNVALEHGGPMDKGQTALVGEAGPELFTAPRAGHIIPNGEFGGDGGKVQVTNNITVAGLDFSSESTAERILAGIADAAKRGVESAIPAASAFSDLALAYSGRVA